MTSSQSSRPVYLETIASIFGTIFIGFGINAMLRPSNALEFFELDMPILPTSQRLVESLLIIYGIRDVFMGIAIYAAALLGNTGTLGWILLAASGVAFADGAVCWRQGKGEWNHWGYAPVVALVGVLLLRRAMR